MIFADHLEGVDTRIEFKKLRVWNADSAAAATALTGNTGAASEGLLRFDASDDSLHLYRQVGAGYAWRKLMDASLSAGSIWYGGSGGAAEEKNLFAIRLNEWAVPDGAINMAGNTITNLQAIPLDDAEAASKGYVDSKVQSGGERQLPPADAATTAAIPGVYNNANGVIEPATSIALTPAMTDGVSLAVGQVLLVKNQGALPGSTDLYTEDVANGLYTVDAVTPKLKLTRHPDMDEDNNVTGAGGTAINEFHNVVCLVVGGTKFLGSSWKQPKPYPDVGTTPLEWVPSSLDVPYKDGKGIFVDAATRTINFARRASENYTQGSLFKALNQDTLAELTPGSTGAFVQCKGTILGWDKSTWTLPESLSNNSILYTTSTASTRMQVLTAGANTVLMRGASGNLQFSTSLPAGMVDLNYPITLAQGGTNRDLDASYNATPADTTTAGHSRHGVLYREEGSNKRMELTYGPSTDLDRILVHKGGVNIGRASWDWLDLWDRSNHFKGDLKIGPWSATWGSEAPALNLENQSSPTSITTNTDSPSLMWTSKYLSSGNEARTRWAAYVNAPSNTTTWKLGAFKNSSTFTRLFEVSDKGKVEQFQNATGTPYATVYTNGTTGTGLHFMLSGTGTLAGIEYVLSTGPAVTLKGAFGTVLRWAGSPIGKQYGGFGENIEEASDGVTKGFAQNRVFYKTSAGWGTVNPTVDNAPLFSRDGGYGGTPPVYAPYALPPTVAGRDGSFLYVSNDTTVDLMSPARNAGDLGPARKKIVSVPATTSTNIDVAHGLGTTDVIVSVREGGSNAQVYVGVTTKDSNTITLNRANADSKTYRVVIVG
jgi:hypothetical protein